MHKPIHNFLTLLLAASAVFAQTTGEVKGTVLDSTGAAVPQAKLMLTSRETGESRSMTGDSEGRFSFRLLKIGAYEVRAEAAGFRNSVTDALVKSGEITTVAFRLEVGQVSESITVTDAVSPLDAGNAQIQYAVDSKEVAEVPVARNPILFALTAPGITPAPANSSFLNSGNFNSNGVRGRSNNITIDNITSTDISTTGNGGSQIGPLNFAQIKEVKLITNNFSAEYGRNGGSQLQFITKSGTNDFHGEAYEFLQNDFFNARDFFDTAGNPTVTRQNQFGYVIGGPIRKNKTHFFQAYEGFQLRGAGAVRIAQVPTADMLSRVTDPTSKKLLDQYKLPAAAVSNADFGTVPQSAPNLAKSFQFSFRLDHQFSEKDSIYLRYAHFQSESQSSGNTFVGTSLANFGASSTNGPRNFNVAETHLFSSTIVNEFRAAYGRSAPIFGISSTVPPGPRIQFNNGQVSTFGPWEGIPQGRVQNTFQYSDTLTWNKGAHNLKFGGDLYRYQANSFLENSTRGVYQFDSWDDFAAGRPASYTQQFGGTVRGHRTWNHFYFAQDDWRVTRNLTLNLGVRTEVSNGISEVNRISSNLNLDCRDSLGAAGSGPLGCFTLGQPSNRTQTNWAPRFGFAWSPRGSLKTVVRGGYGIAYDFNFLNPITNQRSLPPFVTTASITGQSNFTGANSYAALVAGTSQIQRDTLAAVGKINAMLLNYGTVSPVVDTGLRNPQIHQWNFGIQREMAHQIVLKVSYVGTKSDYLQRSRQLNLLNDPRTNPATSIDDETARLNDFRAALAASSGTSTRFSNRIDPRFNAVTLYDSSANSNYHAFEFLAVKQFDRGYAIHIGYTVSKSIDDTSDSLTNLPNDGALAQNPRDLRNNRAVSSFDLPQRLVITHLWELPFGKGIANPLLKRLATGWGFAGISAVRSGFPVTLESGVRRGVQALSLVGSTGGPVRPNATGSVVFDPKPSGSAGSPSGLNNDPYQRISTYAARLGLAQPLIGNFGTLGRNVNRLNGEVNFDWNVYKNTKITERTNLQLRLEMYNVFNAHSFQDVNRTLTSPGFGQYISISQGSRSLQLGARLVF